MIVRNKKIIIIGTLPPPIGGVSIYNKRLYDFLNNAADIEVDFIDYKRNNIFKVIGSILNHEVTYLNCSNSVFKFLLAVIAALFNKKFLFTFHGNLERHSGLTNMLDIFILRIASLSIVLNRQSFEYAKKYSKNVFLGTSFIAPLTSETLSPEIQSLIQNCRKQFKVLCSSNAHNVSFDKDGKEIYQVTFLIDIFRQINDCCIILSDPSGMYSSYLQKHKISLPPNVFIIKVTHSYFELLKEIDIMLRITTTDGDSISVREALYLNKIVIASDVVDRPEGVITVPINGQEILKKLKEVIAGNKTQQIGTSENAGSQILKILRSL